MGEKPGPTRPGNVTKGWDHDPPAKEKLVPFGILMVATGALTLLFGSHETSDAWVDALQIWWRQVRREATGTSSKRLVIYLDNGPKKRQTSANGCCSLAGTVWLRRSRLAVYGRTTSQYSPQVW